MTGKNRSWFLKRLLVLLAAVLIVFSSAATAAAEETSFGEIIDYSFIDGWPAGPEINAEGAYLIELNSGAVLYQKNPESSLYPASITKILTALLVIENCSLDEEVEFSYEAVHDIESGGFSYIADTGDKLSVKDCLYALMLMSSNETAYALAEHVSGSVAAFADLMNQKAAELGCTGSHFTNPHGLTDTDHYTTPEDMARIARAALQNPTFLEIDSTTSYTTAPTSTQPEGYYCLMRHQMMNTASEYYYSAVVAGKTGYLSIAKNTLVTYAKKGSLNLLCVVMKADGSGRVYEDTKALLNYGFDNFSFLPISTEADLAQLEKDATQVLGGRVVQNFDFADTVQVLLPKTLPAVEFDSRLQLDPEAVDGDTAVGQIVYSYNGVPLGTEAVTVELVPETEPATAAPSPSAEATTVKDLFTLDNIWFVVLVVLVVALVVVILLFIIARVRLNRRRRRRRRR